MKEPAQKWTQPNNQSKQIPDINNYNVGIPTGDTNNIVVVDIDIKDGGLLEWTSYIEKYGEPNTLKVNTPSGGFHYYFKKNSENEILNYYVDNFLTTKTKYRNVGIDVRNNGGYVVAPPSKINNIPYSYANNRPLIEVPQTLLNWMILITDSESVSKKITKKQILKQITPNIIQGKNNSYVYDISDANIITILNQLPSIYLTDYYKWLNVMTVLKNLNKYEIFDTWSKKSLFQYDEQKNIKFWNSNNGCMDINFLINKSNIINNTNFKRFKYHKDYYPISDKETPAVNNKK